MSIESFDKLYIGGEWVDAHGESVNEVVNPATEEVYMTFRSASPEDVDAAVAAAKQAFATFGKTTVAERIALLERIVAVYEEHRDEFAEALTREMGAPISLSRTSQSILGVAHLQRTIEALKNQEPEIVRGSSVVVREPAGVAALITPWNWPINQVFTKAASALAAGCTMVLKPSELTPVDAMLFARVLDEAGVPAGVFNLVFGSGKTVGRQLTRHPDVDVVSFTGSTRAGREISIDAAETIKIVHLELGGKSPNVILDDADIEGAVVRGIESCFRNAGQSCSVATRMLVPRSKLAEVEAIAKREAEAYVIGDPEDPETTMGPLVSETQQTKVVGYIETGIEEGQRVLTGGPGRPEGVGDAGYYVKPTIFTDVHPKSTVAQEEIFGPVLCIIAYDTVEEAIAIANDTIYGLAAVVESGDRQRALDIAAQIRAGHVYINGENSDYAAVAFGGWKQSGSGYEHDAWGIEGFQLLKGVLGARA